MRRQSLVEERKNFLGRHDEFFRDFLGREEMLDTIVRYRAYDPLFFPTTLRQHQHQVSALVAYFLEVCDDAVNQSGLDWQKTILMAWIHDDNEPYMEMGDIQSANEWTRTKSESAQIQDDTERSIRMTAKKFSKHLGEFVYENILLDAGLRLTSLEGQVVKFCDKMTGFGEALHEIQSGNSLFLKGQIDPLFGKRMPTPREYYGDYLEKLSGKLPLFALMVKEVDILFLKPPTQGDVFSQAHYDFYTEALSRYAPALERKRVLGA